MKKFKALLICGLIASMVVGSFAGCGKKDDTPEPANIVADIEVSEEVEEEPEIVDTPPQEGWIRSSLTNEWEPGEIATARPIAVMMPADKVAQPQYHIGDAGVLYEILEEGQMSRQMAIIENWQEWEKIGNVRSCRRYYIYMGLEWDAIIVHFGGVYYMEDLITRSDVNNISGTSEFGIGGDAPGAGKFFRSSDKAAPHNAYISGPGIVDASESLGYALEHRDDYWNAEHFKFVPLGGTNDLSAYSDAKDATKIDLESCFPVTKSGFEYDEEAGNYKKTLYHEAQVDAISGEQLRFDNIILQFTNGGPIDPKDYQSFDMIDSGRSGYYITKGKCIPITWKKTSDYEPTRFYDMDGNQIEMNTGKTYIGIIKLESNPVIE